MSVVTIPSGPLRGVGMDLRERRLAGRLWTGLRAIRRRRRTRWVVLGEESRPSR